MGSLAFPVPHHTPAFRPLATGLALSATVTTLYAACTLLWFVAPGPFMSFMNSLFHGMDFNVLLKPGSFSLVGFIGALLVIAIWSLLARTLYGWLRQRLGADGEER